MGMDNDSIFRPIIAYAAHLAVAGSDPDYLETHRHGIENDLSHLVDCVMDYRRNPLDPNFDQSWFAVNAWLHETLERLPIKNPASVLPELPENHETEFFRRLGLLLTPLPGGYPDEILDIIQVYATCIELGYQGYHRHSKNRSDLKRYRSLCAKALADRPPPALPQAVGFTLRRLLSAAAIWATPVVLPLALYGIYKFILQDLYSQVVG